MIMMTRVCHWLEKVGGSRDLDPALIKRGWFQLLLGLWWGALLVVILIFGGQTSKFIYIDF
jgi:hypothetical protein